MPERLLNLDLPGNDRLEFFLLFLDLLGRLVTLIQRVFDRIAPQPVFHAGLTEPLPERCVGLCGAQEPAGEIDEPGFDLRDALEEDLTATHTQRRHLTVEQLDLVLRLVDLFGERVELLI